MKNNTTPDVPVFIDSIKDIGEFKNTRCIYYRVEFDDRLFKVSQSAVPNNFEVMGTWAILTSPFEKSGSENLFISKKIIADTLKYIEDKDYLFLEIGNIWIPNFLVLQKTVKNQVRQGDVYRISKELFSLCYGYVAGFIKETDWIKDCRKYMENIRLSVEETNAFREWRNDTIQKSKDRYDRDDYVKKRLPKKKLKK